MGSDREHLFISYAGENWPLAEWLTLKLTAEGYKVWCDRFKLLGGESYPRDIDDAIKNKTFRVLALLSKVSLKKANPTKERTLALNIARARSIDFLIPINVDGLKSEELDWMTSDLTFVPFYKSWAHGLNQIIEKLEQCRAPKALDNGRQIASRVFLLSDTVVAKNELLYSNLLTFIRIPEQLRIYRLDRVMSPDEFSELSCCWAFHLYRRLFLASFHLPPDLPSSLRMHEVRTLRWNSLDSVEGTKTVDIISTLLRKALKVKCFQCGLRHSVNGYLYFPKGLLRNDRLEFTSYDGKRTWIRVAGERSSKKLGKPLLKYRYHLAPSFNTQIR